MPHAGNPPAPLRVAIIAGSTRPGRKADTVARWVHRIAAAREDATYEIVDIAGYGLPILDEPVPPMAGRYTHPHTLNWAATIAAFDAYVFVTPEYNRSVPAALKNALDYLHAEWNDKAAGFVGYGFHGGVHAIEHLRLILGELKIADVRSPVTLIFGEDFQGHAEFTPRDLQEQRVNAMLDELTAWASALRALRQPDSSEPARPAH